VVHIFSFKYDVITLSVWQVAMILIKLKMRIQAPIT